MGHVPGAKAPQVSEQLGAEVVAGCRYATWVSPVSRRCADQASDQVRVRLPAEHACGAVWRVPDRCCQCYDEATFIRGLCEQVGPVLHQKQPVTRSGRVCKLTERFLSMDQTSDEQLMEERAGELFDACIRLCPSRHRRMLHMVLTGVQMPCSQG